MSKILKFSLSQKTLIRRALNNRLKYDIRDKENQIIMEVIRKLESDFDFFFDKKQIKEIISCIKADAEAHCEMFDLNAHSDLLKYLRISEQDLDKIHIMDEYLDLSNLLGKRSSFRYRKIFEELELLKLCSEVLISGSDRGGYYKIAFLNEQTIHVLEPIGRIEFQHLSSYKISKSSLAAKRTEFNFCFSREEASSFVQRPDFNFGNNRLTTFFQEILA